MYSGHRGMVPGASPRLTELLEQLRVEFESQQNTLRDYEQQSEWLLPDSMILLPSASYMSAPTRTFVPPKASSALMSTHVRPYDFLLLHLKSYSPCLYKHQCIGNPKWHGS